MNSTEEARRPYASPSNVTQVIHRARSRNLPDKVDEDFLRIRGNWRSGPRSLLEALRFLGLIEDDGKPTDILVAISGAPDDEYRATLAAAIQSAYEEDIRRGVDPAQDTQAQIVEAFRRYQPRSQTSRMVMFFLAMCREAGISVSEAPRERGMRSGPRRTLRPRSPHTSGLARTSGPPFPRRKPIPPPTGSLFGITAQDIALLDENEFEEVWAALGKVAVRVRGASLKSPAERFAG